MEQHAGTVTLDQPLALARGGILPRPVLAYATYGRRNAAGDNVVLVCHAMTADQHAAGLHPATGRKGWWDIAIGPGKMLDTDRWQVVCLNVPGGNGGSTAPASLDPATGRPYGMRFPEITIADMVDAQARALDQLGIGRLAAVIGGCMGGFQVLEWARRHPARVGRAVAISATPATSAYTIALWELMRQAIYADPAWNGGDYYGQGIPRTGLALGAMIGSVLWLDRDTLAAKFGRRPAADPAQGFAVQEFLGNVRANAEHRFDANSLIRMTQAVDLYDLTAGHADLAAAVAAITAPVLLVSYPGDWRYPAAEIAVLAQVMAQAGIDVRHDSVDSHIGHGAFQFDVSGLEPRVRAFLDR